MGTPALWIIFNAGVLLLLVLDLGVLNRRAHEVSMREAAAWSVFWVALSLAFNLWILHAHGGEKALQFFTGYLIEQSMSVDNIFIFILVFRSFGVERQYQHRVLFWGILGALILRGTMIGLGTALIRKFEWTLYVLAAFLVVAAIRMLFRKEAEPHPERSRLLRWTQKIFPFSHNYHGQKLWIREAGKRMATPLLLVLLGRRSHRFRFRARFHSRRLRRFSRSLHRVQLEHLRYSRSPRVLLSASRIVARVPIFGRRPRQLYYSSLELRCWLRIGFKSLPGLTLGIIAGILAISMLASIIAMKREKRTGESANGLKSGDK